ncbi:MAG: zinc ribbon domain-containing protein [Ruminiclostridium sp.]|nr:zinc ribbon domain-containing protein [Ruminiclostridium sp.]
MSVVALWLVIVPFFILVPLLLGIFVYRDAKDRGMNPLLWALAAVLCPSFLGLIAYLLVRGSYANWKCPRCGSPVQESFTACPQCGAKLKASCHNCGGAIEKDWQVCPHCASPLDWNDRDFTPPVKPQEKGIGKLILLVILVPILLLALLVFGFSATGVTGSVHTAYLSEVDALRLRHDLRSVHSDWVDLCDQSTDTIQVLVDCQEGGDQALWIYLIYLPETMEGSASTGVGRTLLGRTTMTVDYMRFPNEGGIFLCMSGWSDQEPKLRVYDQNGGVGIQETQSLIDLNHYLSWEGMGASYEVEAMEEHHPE